MAKTAAKKSPTKSEVYANIAEATELSKKQVAAVFDALSKEVSNALSKKGPGMFTIPNLCKVVVKHKKAQPAKKNVLNRFTGQMMDVPAKPASNVVRVKALKALREMVK